MWKEYSLGYIKNNRSSGLSVRFAAFISALLLSLLCGLFYNAWKYEVERIELTEGGWQSRLVGALGHEELEVIKNFANVKEAAINTRESSETETVVDLYFNDMGAVLSDTPRIAEAVGIAPEKAVYHYQLLAMYLIGLRRSWEKAAFSRFRSSVCRHSSRFDFKSSSRIVSKAAQSCPSSSSERTDNAKSRS